MQYFIIKTINNCKKCLHFIWYHDIIKTVKEYTLTNNQQNYYYKKRRERGKHYGKEIKQLQKDSTVFTEDL